LSRPQCWRAFICHNKGPKSGCAPSTKGIQQGAVKSSRTLDTTYNMQRNFPWMVAPDLPYHLRRAMRCFPPKLANKFLGLQVCIPSRFEQTCFDHSVLYSDCDTLKQDTRVDIPGTPNELASRIASLQRTMDKATEALSEFLSQAIQQLAVFSVPASVSTPVHGGPRPMISSAHIHGRRPMAPPRR
jgi:hypothetical protein